MRLETVQTWRTRLFQGSASVVSAALLVVVIAGCPPVAPQSSGSSNGNSNGNENTNDNQSLEAEMVTPSTNFGISALDAPVSFLYTVMTEATSVQGFYVPVADAGPGSPATGPRVVTHPNLPTGERQAFSFDPTEVEVGYYRVGILYSLGGAEDGVVESRAVIEVQAGPNPNFLLIQVQDAPDPIFPPWENSIEVTQGKEIRITFDVGDPEDEAQWRLFYFPRSDAIEDLPGDFDAELTVGSGNAGTFTLSTEDLSPGDYQLGLSATDSGRSVAATIEDEDLHRIVTIPSGSTATPIIRVVVAP